MVLTGYKWQGVAIRTLNGHLAGSPDCCCDVVESCDTCPPASATFTGTVSGQTGDATQITGPLTATYEGTLNAWACHDFPGSWGDCDDPFDRFVTISCIVGTIWGAGIAGGTEAAQWGLSANVDSYSCDPATGKWTIVVTYTLAGGYLEGACATGVFTVTWVQD